MSQEHGNIGGVGRDVVWMGGTMRVSEWDEVGWNGWVKGDRMGKLEVYGVLFYFQVTFGQISKNLSEVF